VSGVLCSDVACHIVKLFLGALALRFIVLRQTNLTGLNEFGFFYSQRKSEFHSFENFGNSFLTIQSLIRESQGTLFSDCKILRERRI